MSLIKWPFKRKTYSGLDNPRFVDDITAANEAVIDGMTVLTGLESTDFAIISGLNFLAGTPNVFTDGIFYLNGAFYYQSTGFNENLYLLPTPTDIMPKVFGDTNTRNIYTSFASASTSSPTGATPQFVGNMNAYRIGLKYNQSVVNGILTTLAGLGTAAVANVGTSSGNVVDAAYLFIAGQLNVLTLTNTVAFTPTGNYQPATKKYVDQIIGARLKGTFTVGIPITGDTLYTVSFGITLPDANYMVMLQVVTNNNPPLSGDNDITMTVCEKTTTSFGIWFGKNGSASSSNISVDWILF